MIIDTNNDYKRRKKAVIKDIMKTLASLSQSELKNVIRNDAGTYVVIKYFKITNLTFYYCIPIPAKGIRITKA